MTDTYQKGQLYFTSDNSMVFGVYVNPPEIVEKLETEAKRLQDAKQDFDWDDLNRKIMGEEVYDWRVELEWWKDPIKFADEMIRVAGEIKKFHLAHPEFQIDVEID